MQMKFLSLNLVQKMGAGQKGYLLKKELKS